MAISRVYTVRPTEEGEGRIRLIRAPNRATALRYALQSAYTVESASQDDLINLLESGVRVEECNRNLENMELDLT